MHNQTITFAEGNPKLTRNAGYPCVRVVEYLAVRTCDIRSLGATLPSLGANADRDSDHARIKVGGFSEKR